MVPGELRQEQGRREAARELFEESVALAAELLEGDPENAEFQEALRAGQQRLANLGDSTLKDDGNEQ